MNWFRNFLALAMVIPVMIAAVAAILVASELLSLAGESPIGVENLLYLAILNSTFGFIFSL